MTTRPHAVDVRRRAGCLPEDQDYLKSWLDGHRERVEAKGGQVVLHPVLTEFQELIETDPVVRMINEVLTMAPEFGGHMVATPLGAILDWAMGTPAGFAAFRDPRVNAMLKKILSAWCEFLSSSDSLYVLNDSPSGWKNAEAQRTVGMEQYEHDPQDAHWGFASWNDFFTRRFKDGERPVASPDDDKVIVTPASPRPTASAQTSSARTASGSTASRIRLRTCWPMTIRSISSSAGPSIRPS